MDRKVYDNNKERQRLGVKIHRGGMMKGSGNLRLWGGGDINHSVDCRWKTKDGDKEKQGKNVKLERLFKPNAEQIPVDEAYTPVGA